MGSAETVALDPVSYVSLVHDAALTGTADGQIFDAVIAACGPVESADEAWLVSFCVQAVRKSARKSVGKIRSRCIVAS